MNPSGRFLDRQQVIGLIAYCKKMQWPIDYNFAKHSIEFSAGESVVRLRLPITLKPDETFNLSLDSVKYLMLLVQSGSAAIGVFEAETCLSHKVLTAYMIRKKQGKSQLKYLKTRGKSRAGSRVRLASTTTFFENINSRLAIHFAAYQFDRIVFSCSKILLPHLFNSKTPTPFDRKDERIYHIPRHLYQPNFEVMLGMQRFLNKGELIYEQKDEAMIAVLMAHL